MVKRGIIHVDNTEGIADFARFLTDSGWTIFSANKTEEILKRENIPVEKERSLAASNFYLADPSSLIRKILTAKNDETTDYFNRDKADDTLSLVCININPQMRMNIRSDDIEDIMNPQSFFFTTVLRDSVVNYKNLLILTDPADYEEAVIQLRTDNITDEFRTYLAGKALNMISAFDGGIASSILLEQGLKKGNFMNYLMFPFIKQETYTTGANPQQISCLYKFPAEIGAVNGFNRYTGLKADYNTVSDSAFAWEIISSLYSNLRTQYTVPSTNCDGYNFTTQCTPLTGTVFTIAVKFKSVLGASLATNVLDSFNNAMNFDCDSIDHVSLGCSAVIDESAAREIIKFSIDAIVAPGFTQEAKNIIGDNSDIRLIPIAKTSISPFDLQLVNGGLIFQTKDSTLFEHWNVKTKHRPNQFLTDEMAFGMVLAMGSRTHSAVLIKNNSIAGIAQCCSSSTKAVTYALEEALDFQKRINQDANNDYKIADVLVCDTEIGLTEALKELISKGVSAIIQTGGDKTDEELIKYCDDSGISLVFTGMTHISY